MNLRHDFTRFLEIRNYAPATIAKYLRAVHDLAWHYHRRPDQLGMRELQHYLHYLAKTKRYSWNSIHNIAFGLRCFYFKFLNWPFHRLDIPVPKLPKRLPLVWTPGEIQRLIAAAAWPEMCVMIQLGYATGMRLGEMCRLQWRCLDSDHRTIWVRAGKGNKDRAAIYPPRLEQVMRAYRGTRTVSSWVFPGPTDSNRPISTTLVVKRFLKVKARAGLERVGGMHSLRHSFATHQIARGTDIYTVQRLLGHKHVTTTQVYVHLAQGIVLSRARHLDLLDFQSLRS